MIRFTEFEICELLRMLGDLAYLTLPCPSLLDGIDAFVLKSKEDAECNEKLKTDGNSIFVV